MIGITRGALPLVSIVVPVSNDQDTIRAALDSALNQTLSQIEIVVVDDASSDATAQIVDDYVLRDPRIRLIRHAENRSAFQARRTGILAARAPYILFLDGDDELERHAAAVSATAAERTKADLVQFGVRIVLPGGTTGGSWEARSQPKHSALEGERIVAGLFPPGVPAAGQLWKYLFRAEVLRAAYDATPAEARFFRANDLPIAFLASIIAQRYVSVPDKLYRYFWRRGASAIAATTTQAIDFQVSAIDAFDAITDFVREAAYRHPDPEALFASHDSARASIISNAMKWGLDTPDPELFRYALTVIEERVGRAEMIRAAVRYQPTVLTWLAERQAQPRLGSRSVKNVLITSANLTTGGVSMVVLAQARFLAATGHRVTIAVRRRGNDTTLLPEGVSFYEVTEGDLAEKVDMWAEICARENIDVVIDHRILYSTDWHALVLMAAAHDIPTIGWIHSFAGRPVYDLNDMHSYLRRALPSLAQVVTLSPLDVAFWKLRGISRTVYLPNPPSPMILEHSGEVTRKEAPKGRIELVWIGRMEQHTKQVRSVLKVAGELRKLDVDFRLRVVGPDHKDYSAAEFNQEAAKRGLSDSVEAIGPLQGAELIEALDSAHAFVTTSIIEGYQLTITEAQTRGLPVFMYEMPWLVSVQDNDGIVAVPQGDAAGMALRIAALLGDAEAYESASRAALSAARRVQEIDYSTLYRQLVDGELPEEYSPRPTLTEAGEVLDLTLFFAERHAGLRQRLETAQDKSRVAQLQSDLANQQIAVLRKRLAEVETSDTATRAVGGAGRRAATQSPGSNAIEGRAKPVLLARSLSRRAIRKWRTWTDRSVRLIGAKVREGSLILRLRVPRGQKLLRVELYGTVNGADVIRALSVSRDTDGTMLAARDLATLELGRWKVRASVQSGQSQIIVGIPIHPDAANRGDSSFNVRFTGHETFDVYARRAAKR